MELLWFLFGLSLGFFAGVGAIMIVAMLCAKRS
jgi:hypothetical protein